MSDLLALIQPILDRTEGQIGTHSDRCFEYHVACLAGLVKARLTPVVVSTIEELDALPLHTVLRDRQSDIWESYIEPGGLKAWGCTGDTEPRSKNWVALPAAVLFRPDTEGES